MFWFYFSHILVIRHMWKIKLASSPVNFWAHDNILPDWSIDISLTVFKFSDLSWLQIIRKTWQPPHGTSMTNRSDFDRRNCVTRIIDWRWQGTHSPCTIISRLLAHCWCHRRLLLLLWHYDVLIANGWHVCRRCTYSHMHCITFFVRSLKRQFIRRSNMAMLMML